jgi:hypothetical protein
MNRASLLNFYDSMEHFLSLSIPEIQNYQWNNQSSEEIQNYFIRLEDEWKSNQKQLIPFSEDDTIIKKMNNNFYWVDLETSYCKKEGASMGHCGNSPRSGTDDTIYSLRELKIINGQKYWHPFVTITVDDELMVWETKGRGNQKPASRYIPYVVELFKDKNYIKGIREGVGYLPENNLRFEKDFTDEQQNEIEEANPDFEIAKKLPLVLIYDEIATAQEIMSENGVEDNLEYAYRDRGAEYEGRNRYYRADDIDDDEYDDIYNNAAIYRVTDYDEVLKYCYEIYENESGGRYYEEDRRFENLVSFFSNPWVNPDDKDIAKQAVYDFFDNANETFIEYKDDYGSEPVDEDDRDEFLLNVVKDFNEEYKTLIKFCETLEEEFPFTFNWELGNNDIPRTYKNPDQLEFKFESYKNILKHYEVL